MDHAILNELFISVEIIYDLRNEASDIDRIGAGEKHIVFFRFLMKLLIEEELFDLALGVVKIPSIAYTPTLFPSWVAIWRYWI